MFRNLSLSRSPAWLPGAAPLPAALAPAGKRDSWCHSYWPRGSGLLAVPRPPERASQTLLIDFPNQMIEYWVSIDRRPAISIHDFRRAEAQAAATFLPQHLRG